MNNPKDTLEEQPVLNSDTSELVKEEVTNMTDEEKQMSSEAEVSEAEVSDEDKLVQLKEFRKNGNVTLDVSYSSFKMIRNTFKNKVAWTGPNQAYLLCVLNMNMEQALSSMDSKSPDSQKVAIRNDSVEAMSVFINDISGDNYHSAQNNLSMFLQIQQAIAQLQTADKQIESLVSKIDNNLQKK
tara:strand:- start:11653 stop:12204 length:552 start_codon:yes stop_codon:yes gene_type:complete